MSTVTGAAAAGRDIVARADALGRAYEAHAATSDDEPRRASLARAAGRLAASVVRPLSAALEQAFASTPARVPLDAELEGQ